MEIMNFVNRTNTDVCEDDFLLNQTLKFGIYDSKSPYIEPSNDIQLHQFEGEDDDVTAHPSFQADAFFSGIALSNSQLAPQINISTSDSEIIFNSQPNASFEEENNSTSAINTPVVSTPPLMLEGSASNPDLNITNANNMMQCSNLVASTLLTLSNNKNPLRVDQLDAMRDTGLLNDDDDVQVAKDYYSLENSLFNANYLFQKPKSFTSHQMNIRDHQNFNLEPVGHDVLAFKPFPPTNIPSQRKEVIDLSDESSTNSFLHFAELKGVYHGLEKIGEGTFSSVYKAKCNDLKVLARRGEYTTPDTLVAMKRIYPTCAPNRILNEMIHLKNLGGRAHVPPILGALRHNDQVTILLPHFPHDKFKEYVATINVHQIGCYMKALFESLEHLHKHNVLHRDIKPGNFLCDLKNQRFMLVDFGLAELASDQFVDLTADQSSHRHPSNSPLSLSQPQLKRKQNPLLAPQQSATNKRTKSASTNSFKLGEIAPHSPYPIKRTNSMEAIAKQQQQQRKPTKQKIMHAPRAGTRGFRAPEVLLKYQHQTTAIDIWSAGVILLCITSTRYPFFNSPDDLASLAEIGAICGTKEVSDVALSLGRKVHFPVEIPKADLKEICTRLSSRKEGMLPDSIYDLLAKCLELDPRKRISAADALQHPFFVDAFSTPDAPFLL